MRSADKSRLYGGGVSVVLSALVLYDIRVYGGGWFLVDARMQDIIFNE